MPCVSMLYYKFFFLSQLNRVSRFKKFGVGKVSLTGFVKSHNQHINAYIITT